MTKERKVPVTPVVKGSPVALVSVPEDGVPKAGVTSVGDVERTADPEPVVVVTPVPPPAGCSTPDEFTFEPSAARLAACVIYAFNTVDYALH